MPDLIYELSLPIFMSITPAMTFFDYWMAHKISFVFGNRLVRMLRRYAKFWIIY